MYQKGRGEGALRAHRISEIGATYFVTLCTRCRKSGLLHPEVTTSIKREQQAMARDGHWFLRCFVIMPDHLHLLVRLTGALPISRCLSRFKSKTRPSLAAAQLQWQPNFFEHRMRPDEPIEPVLRYLFLNPYRKGIVSADTPYPGFWLSPEDVQIFSPNNGKACPIPEWLAR